MCTVSHNLRANCKTDVWMELGTKQIMFYWDNITDFFLYLCVLSQGYEKIKEENNYFLIGYRFIHNLIIGGKYLFIFGVVHRVQKL